MSGTWTTRHLRSETTPEWRQERYRRRAPDWTYDMVEGQRRAERSCSRQGRQRRPGRAAAVEHTLRRLEASARGAGSGAIDQGKARLIPTAPRLSDSPRSTWPCMSTGPPQRLVGRPLAVDGQVQVGQRVLAVRVRTLLGGQHNGHGTPAATTRPDVPPARPTCRSAASLQMQNPDVSSVHRVVQAVETTLRVEHLTGVPGRSTRVLLRPRHCDSIPHCRVRRPRMPRGTVERHARPG